jgi:hypothetical protein
VAQRLLQRLIGDNHSLYQTRAAERLIGSPAGEALSYLLPPGRCEGLAGAPGMAEVSSGTHFISLRSYLIALPSMPDARGVGAGLPVPV